MHTYCICLYKAFKFGLLYFYTFWEKDSVLNGSTKVDMLNKKNKTIKSNFGYRDIDQNLINPDIFFDIQTLSRNAIFR